MTHAVLQLNHSKILGKLVHFKTAGVSVDALDNNINTCLCKISPSSNMNR